MIIVTIVKLLLLIMNMAIIGTSICKVSLQSPRGAETNHSIIIRGVVHAQHERRILVFRIMEHPNMIPMNLPATPSPP